MNVKGTFLLCLTPGAVLLVRAAVEHLPLDTEDLAIQLGRLVEERRGQSMKVLFVDDALLER